MIEFILRPRGEPTTVVAIDENGACDNYAVDRLDNLHDGRNLDTLDELDLHLLAVECRHLKPVDGEHSG